MLPSALDQECGQQPLAIARIFASGDLYAEAIDFLVCVRAKVPKIAQLEGLKRSRQELSPVVQT